MHVRQALCCGAAVAVLAGTAIGTGIVPATADPGRGGGDQDQWVDNRGNWRDNGRGNDWNRPTDVRPDLEFRGWDDRQEWKRWNDNDWNQWWRVNKWRNDDRPPWGWGAPPPVYWRGHPPQWIDYWGYRVYPVWHPHIRVFGFWLHGIFIPVWVI